MKPLAAHRTSRVGLAVGMSVYLTPNDSMGGKHFYPVCTTVSSNVTNKHQPAAGKLTAEEYFLLAVLGTVLYIRRLPTNRQSVAS